MEKWEHLRIPLGDIQHATNYFQKEKEIGRGGYGSVYEGELAVKGNLTKVAVKKLNLNETNGQGLKEFLTEIDLLSGHQHENIITLVGYCDEGNEKIIVYEHAEHGSLDKYIRCNNSTKYTLTWLKRLKIVVDVAQGLDHLHNHLHNNQVIIHRDIKSSNILLDQNWVAKISDLGLSKSTISGFGRTTVVSHACGTLGYVEPEFIKYGLVSKQSDVYSFGMLLFEVLCGRLCTIRDDDRILLSADVAKDYYDNNKLLTLIDTSLQKQMCQNVLARYSNIAYKCLLGRDVRPSIENVKKKLEGLLKLEIKNNAVKRKSENPKSKDEVKRQKRNSNRNNQMQGKEFRDEEDNIASSAADCLKKPTVFSFDEIERATSGFAIENFLGKDMFGEFYRGDIFGREFAMKRMHKKGEKQIYVKFVNEIKLLSTCDHVNIISLVGYCDEKKERILVYEYMPNRSLYGYLYKCQDITPCLSVEQRLEICIGVAKGLSYLHSDTHVIIIHRDITSFNILLDRNMVPKISGFGVACKHDLSPTISQVNTNRIEGTKAYLAPECSGPKYKLSRKADVYAFGVTLLEVLCEKSPSKRPSLVLLAIPLLIEGELNSLLTEDVKANIDPECLHKCENLIRRCLENNPDKRPVMSEVVKQLESALKLQQQKQDV